MDIKINPIFWLDETNKCRYEQTGIEIKTEKESDFNFLANIFRNMENWKMSYCKENFIRLEPPMQTPTDDMSKKDFMVKSAMDHFSNELSGMIERHQKEGFELLYSFRKAVREVYNGNSEN